MIDVEDWAEIRRLHRAEGLGIKAIARRMKVARNTVRETLRSEEPPRYERARRGSGVDAFEPAIRELLAEVPTMPATVIVERVGWARSMTTLRDRVAELRPLFRPPDPCQRTHYRPGELAQFDLWQPDTAIPLGHGQADKLWVVVGVTGHARFTGAWMVPSRAAHDVLAGMLRVLGQFGAVPRRAVWDQEGCIGQWRQGRQRLTGEFQAFRGTLGMGAVLCAPADPEANPFSESQFKTFKYRPDFPGRFGSIEDARAHCQPFFRWYNFEHRHAGIALLTPADVHHGRAAEVIAARGRVLTGAYAANPERFVRKPPTPRELHVASWINRPDEKEEAAR